jgi:hypothetical protein
MTQYKRWKRAAKFAQKLESDYNEGYIDFYLKNYMKFGHRDPSKIIYDHAVTKETRKLFIFSRDEGETTMRYKDMVFHVTDPNGLVELMWDIRNPNYGKEVFQKFYVDHKEEIKNSYLADGDPGWYWSHLPGLMTTSPHLTMEMIVEITGLDGLKAFMSRLCISKGPRFSDEEIDKYKDALSWQYILKTHPKLDKEFLVKYKHEMIEDLLPRYPWSLVGKSIILCTLSNESIKDNLFFECLESIDGMSVEQFRRLSMFFRAQEIVDYALRNRKFSYQTYKKVLIDGDKNIFKYFNLIKNNKIPTSILQELIERDNVNLMSNYYLNMTHQQCQKLGFLKKMKHIKGFGYRQFRDSEEKAFGDLRIESSIVGREEYFEQEFKKYMAVTKIKNCWKKWYDSPNGPGPQKYWNEFQDMVSESKRIKY